MVNSASPWQHTAIPLDAAISRRADASLNAPFVRLWQAFLSGRVLLALALVLLQTLNLQLQNISTPLVWLVCIVYLALTLIMRLAAARHLPAPRAGMQWLPVIGVDIAVIFLLQILQAGSLNYTALLAIPVLIGVLLVGFLLMQVVPTDPATVRAAFVIAGGRGGGGSLTTLGGGRIALAGRQ